MEIRLQLPEKLVPLIVKPKRLKIAVGGRGAAKSITFADVFLKYCSDGEKVCCAREFQNSIDDSVHSLLKSRIEVNSIGGMSATATTIESVRGGQIIYKGLARNIQSIKSMFGVKRIWIEEGQTLSDSSLDTLMPTIREDDSEIWVSMNRGSSKDPISKRYLNAIEHILEAKGYYEDDDMIVVQINWQDNPFFPDVLESERQRDLRVMSRAKYDHIWEGKYSDSVENAIILPEWFDACVDSHIRLSFKPEGIEVVAHDPSDQGEDAKGLCYRHGNVIVDVQQMKIGDVNEGADWATGYANKIRADLFIWDVDGMGAGLRRQISDSLSAKAIPIDAFSGAASADNPDQVYQPIDGEISKPKSNRETFANKRAQYYWNLRDRCYKTWLSVTQLKHYPADDLISFSSAIADMPQLRSEICRIPSKENGAGKVQIMRKDEMRKMGISSPNLADAVMMSLSGKRQMESKPIRRKLSVV